MSRSQPFLRSLFDAVFHRPQMQAVNGYFSTFTAYAPSFTTWQGGLYEAELTRSIIESGADHASRNRKFPALLSLSPRALSGSSLTRG